MSIVIAFLVLVILALIVMWQREIHSHKTTLDVLEAKLDEAYQKIFDQRHELAQKDREYAALDQGMFEQADAYEQEFLTFREVLESQKNALNDLNHVRDVHYDSCLPWLDLMEEFTRFTADVYEETPIFDSIVLETAG